MSNTGFIFYQEVTFPTKGIRTLKDFMRVGNEAIGEKHPGLKMSKRVGKALFALFEEQVKPRKGIKEFSLSPQAVQNIAENGKPPSRNDMH